MKLLTPEGMKIATLTLITNRTRQEELENAQYFFSPLFPPIYLVWFLVFSTRKIHISREMVTNEIF